MAENRFDWLVGAVVTDIGYNLDGTPATVWVEKDEVRARLTLTPILVYDPEHIDGQEAP